MKSPDEIFSRYSGEMKDVERYLFGIFESTVSLIPLIGRYIVGTGGKRIRPLFLLLAAELCGYRNEDRARLAAIIEAIHTASLLHDDVIDGAQTRRGKPAANSLWGNQVVILVGDFLYSNALRLAVERKNQKIMEALSEATTRMTRGEILQLHRIGDPRITLDEYYDIISSKTGILLSAACRIGAILAGLPDAEEQSLAAFGLKTGIAFQLADDVLDYVADQNDLGKRLGKDLEEGKITMPLIRVLSTATSSEKEEVIAIVTEATDHQQDSGGRNLSRIMELFSKYNAIEDSLSAARSLIGDAENELSSFTMSEEKDNLLSMSHYAIQRGK